MFEDKTFENILSEMLSDVSSKNPELDTREGSMIYTALAPIALELETAYRDMNAVLEETFIETASKDYLIKHGDQIGVDLNYATCGHFKGEFNVDLPIGSRFNLDDFNYIVVDKLYDKNEVNGVPYYGFELVCETPGSEPNSYFGDLTPITHVANLMYAKIIEVLVYGEDEEETESFRYRLLTHLKEPPINGNVSQYNEWLDEYAGIGKYKVIPRWNGANTVKLIILDSEDKAATTELIEEVQEYFDPNETGMGDGQAPIGTIVTVDTVTQIPVVFNCELVLEDGYTTPIGVQEAVENYLKAIVFEKNIISYMPLSAEVYNAESVKEVSNLTITVGDTVMNPNDPTFISSVTIDDTEIAVLAIDESVWRVVE